MNAAEIGSFDEYRKLIMVTLDRLDAAVIAVNLRLDSLRDREVSDLKVDVAMLKVKASLIGAGSGFAAAALMHFLLK